jgi:hypothetical protein
MMRMHGGTGRTVLAGLLCAMCVSVALAGASYGVTQGSPGAAGCGAAPAWIESATVSQGGQEALTSCFQSSSSQAEAVLRITNNRPYAQLITVSGATLDLAESSFAGSLEAKLSRLLANLSPAGTPSPFLLGPGQGASVSIDRPPPGAAQVVHLYPAPGNAFAVGALAFKLLNSAAKRMSLGAGTESCIATAVHGALSTPPEPELALRRIHACVNAAPLRANAARLLKKLASSVLRNAAFRQVIHREGSETHPARIAYTVAPSNPNLPNAAIRLSPLDLGTLQLGQVTVRHLTASGGLPPYRFYLVPEAGGPAVPSWLKLAADGTLSIEPLTAGSSVNFTVEVVDSNGEHSVVPV